jgi:hypothetical protein
MSAPLPLNAPDIPITRTGVLAAASVLVATCSVAVTLAVTSGGGGTDAPAADAAPRSATGITEPRSPAAGGKPEIAEPDAATLYHHRAMERRR